MFRRYGLPLFGLLCLAGAVLHAIRAQAPPPELSPPVDPGRTPFNETVAGVGIVESPTENIAIGAPVPGVVSAVLVHPGQTVHAGTALFSLDERQARAELKVRKANLQAAEAQLRRLEQLPRAEELPPAEARIREAEAHLGRQADLLRRAEKLHPRAVPEQEVVERAADVRVARARLDRARAEHALLRAGAWGPDRAVARAAVEQARALLEQAQTELDRLVVRAPVAGQALQVNVRPGESVSAAPGPGLVVLGGAGRLHVRVSLDEHDIPRFRPDAPARAAIRGHPQLGYPLTFVRVQPHVVPKKTLTNDSQERVDTRVLEVIYAVEVQERPLFVGQQLDVFIEARAHGL